MIGRNQTAKTAETLDFLPANSGMLALDEDGSVSLLALVNNRYVTAENAGAAPLIANRTAIGPWEQFDLVVD